MSVPTPRSARNARSASRRANGSRTGGTHRPAAGRSRRPSQRSPVALGQCAAASVPLVEMGQLGPKHGGLQLRPGARPSPVPRSGTSGASRTCRSRRARSATCSFGGHDRAAVAQRAEVLGRIEAERRGIAEACPRSRPLTRAVRLGAVLEQLQAARRPRARVDLSRLAVEVDHEHGAGREVRSALDLGRVERRGCAGRRRRRPGAPPAATTAATGGTPALAGTSTSSPGSTPSACRPIRMASVPEPTPTACAASVVGGELGSKRSSSGPIRKKPLSSTRPMAASNSGRAWRPRRV